MDYGQLEKNKTDELTPYVYVVTRKDLSFSQQCVQSCHAAINAANKFPSEVHPHLVLCSVSNENELYRLCNKIQRSEIRFTFFEEPDIGNSLTAIATEPIFGRDRKIFAHLHLMEGGAP